MVTHGHKSRSLPLSLFYFFPSHFDRNIACKSCKEFQILCSCDLAVDIQATMENRDRPIHELVHASVPNNKNSYTKHTKVSFIVKCMHSMIFGEAWAFPNRRIIAELVLHSLNQWEARKYKKKKKIPKMILRVRAKGDKDAFSVHTSNTHTHTYKHWLSLSYQPIYSI